MIRQTNIINYDKRNKYYQLNKTKQINILTMIKETNIINYDKRNKYY